MSVRQRVALRIALVMLGAFLLLTAAASWTTLTTTRDAIAAERDALLRPALEDRARERGLVTPGAAGAFCLALHEARAADVLAAVAFVDPVGRPCFADGLPATDPAVVEPGRPDRVEPARGLYAADVAWGADPAPRGRVALRFRLGEPPPVGTIVMRTLATHGAIFALCTLLLVVSAYLLLDRVVLRPLEGLAAASRRIAAGDYGATVPEPTGRDEIADLLRAFNQMTAEVRGYHGELERRVADATARVKATERNLVLAQRLAAMGTLAAGIAHEVNNPLGGMLNAARRLHGDVPAGRARTYVELLTDGLQRIEQTVRKVLQFTPRSVHPAPVDLRDLVRRAVDLARHRLDKQGITFVEALPEDLPTVEGEANELTQVFLNLLINAVDATPTGGRIPLAGRRGERGVEVDVADTGSGMDEATLARCFDLFFTTKAQGEGTGLGLAIVHHIVTAHGGTIELASAPGKGTTVHLRFPTAVERAASRRLPVVAPPPPPARL